MEYFREKATNAAQKSQNENRFRYVCNDIARQARWVFIFWMFGEDTRAMGRFYGSCMGRLSVRCFIGLGTYLREGRSRKLSETQSIDLETLVGGCACKQMKGFSSKD